MLCSNRAVSNVEALDDDLKENVDGSCEDEAAVRPLLLQFDDQGSDMDRRSWLWRRKSMDKSPGETESSGSISSHSERFSDDQEVLKSSPSQAQSPEVSSNVTSCEDQDTLKSLSEKLSAALLNIRAKEDLVKQHTKVAEEAVSGWEKAEIEVANLKQQLETRVQKNSTLEDKVSQLDGALKECVRQLRLAREEQEKKVHDAVIEKASEWETEKFELESRVIELESQLETSKADESASVNHDFQVKLEALEKENTDLTQELHSQSEKLRISSLERELSTQAAETASKQHLESIKKMTKLESECRRLRAMTRKPQSSNEQRSFSSSIYVESLTDSQSDSGERMLALDNEPSCSDSWASALIAELDQFKSEKYTGKGISASNVEIDLMDDFLEMEKLAALPEANHGSPAVEIQVISDETITQNCALKADLEHMLQRTTELEEKIARLEGEKSEFEFRLGETLERFEMSSNKLKEAEFKLLELQKQLDSSRASKQVSDIAIEAAEAKRKVLETQLGVADSEVRKLHEKVHLLEGELKREKTMAEDYAIKCEKLEDELERRKQKAELRRAARSNGELKMKQENELVVAANKLAECQQTIASLGQQLKSLVSFEGFMLEAEKMGNGGSPITKGGEATRESILSFSPETAVRPLSLSNGKERRTPPSSSLSSSFVGFSKSF